MPTVGARRWASAFGSNHIRSQSNVNCHDVIGTPSLSSLLIKKKCFWGEIKNVSWGPLSNTDIP